jgi:hypothetical protein
MSRFDSFSPLCPFFATGLVYSAAGLSAQPTAVRTHGAMAAIACQPAGGPHAAGSVPAFLRSEAAVNEIEYLGPEPDRWRSPAEPELNAAQAPEHFIDLEPADALGPLPHNRLDFEAKVFAAGERPEKIGLQPWETTEVWERLKAALREYRALRQPARTRAAWKQRRFLCGLAGALCGRWRRSRCTQQFSTTAGWDRTPTATPPA